MDQPKLTKTCIIKIVNFNSLKYNFFVFAYNRAEIDKQCEQ